jgi:hypothetical protein
LCPTRLPRGHGSGKPGRPRRRPKRAQPRCRCGRAHVHRMRPSGDERKWESASLGGRLNDTRDHALAFTDASARSACACAPAPPPASACEECSRAASSGATQRAAAAEARRCARRASSAAASAPGLGSSRPHQHRDWARPAHIFTRTGRRLPVQCACGGQRKACGERLHVRRTSKLKETASCASVALNGPGTRGSSSVGHCPYLRRAFPSLGFHVFSQAP